MKIIAALLGGAMGIAGSAMAALVFVRPAKLFVSNSSVTPPGDTTAPTVASITRASASPTNAGSVQFTVTFSEAVTGVGPADFALNVTAVTGAGVTAVSADSGATRTVTVATGTGSGTIRLDVVDDDSIVDDAGNKLGGTAPGNGDFTTGEVYTIDKASPTVTGIARAGSDPTSASSVQFTVTFSEAVTGVGTADFTLTTAGLSGAGVSSVSTDSGSSRTVTVSTGTGDGTIRLDLSDDDSITDTAGNALGGAGTGNGSFTSGQSYTIDKTPPTVSSITLTGTSPTNASSAQFTVTFSEAVTGVGGTDFVLTTTGVSGTSVSSVSADSGATRTVTVATGTGDGTIRLDLSDDDSIVDNAGNALGGAGTGNGSFTSGPAYTVDKTAPTAAIAFPVAGAFYNTAGFNAGCSTGLGDFCGTAVDVGGSVADVRVSLRRGSTHYWDGSVFAPTSMEVLLNAIGAASWSFSFDGSSFGADGSYTLRSVPRDAAGNSGTAAATFEIDNSAPAGMDIQTANKAAGVAGKAELDDTITFTFNEQMKPASIMAGWDGLPTSVTVSFTKGTGGSPVNSFSVTSTNLGSVSLGNGEYVSANLTFTGSTMVLSGNQVVITLGTTTSAKVTTAAANTTVVWTPGAGMTDRAGNPLPTAGVPETGTADKEF